MTASSSGPLLAFWCSDGDHHRCTHVPGHLVGEKRRTPEVRDDLDEVEPCRCQCHDDCPLSAQENALGWPDACDCFGTLAGLQREKKLSDHSTTTKTTRTHSYSSTTIKFGKVLRQSLDKSSRKRRARAELHRRARGLSAEEADGLLDEIWTGQGLDAPNVAIRRSLVEEALHPPSPPEKAVRTAEGLEGLGRWVGDIVQMFRTPESVPKKGPNSFRLPTGTNEVEVELDGGTNGRLSALGKGQPFFNIKYFSGGWVDLRSSPEEDIEVFITDPGTEGPDGRIGVLRGENAEPFRRGVAAAERVGQTASVFALRVAVKDGDHLYVKLPLTRSQLTS